MNENPMTTPIAQARKTRTVTKNRIMRLESQLAEDRVTLHEAEQFIREFEQAPQ